METGEKFEKLVGIIETLRSPDGCPWDKEQTHESVKSGMIEESYEVIDAIDAKDNHALCEELGDLLLQVLFHAEMAREESVFDIDDVVDAISAKLVRRHPHVFGNTQVADSEEVIQNWEEIKRGEKGYEKRTSVLDGVPKTLPALARAMDISKKAAKVGFEWPNLEAVVDKLDEEVHELKEELAAQRTDRIAEEIGDLLFTVVNIARWTKVDPEDALRKMTKRFSARFRQIEAAAAESGRRIEEMSIEEMDAVWNKAKQEK